MVIPQCVYVIRTVGGLHKDVNGGGEIVSKIASSEGADGF